MRQEVALREAILWPRVFRHHAALLRRRRSPARRLQAQMVTAVAGSSPELRVAVASRGTK
jgi:hypothetical protein